MEYIADLHIHSRYSRATSKDCNLEYLDLWARKKGISILGTGDFTHPVWRDEIKQKLIPAEDGFYKLQQDSLLEETTCYEQKDPRFVISGEISSIYKKNGKTRKIHNVILLPGLEEAEKLSAKLEKIGNLHSDGRPILGLDAKNLLEMMLDVTPDGILIPAHIWTPHFSLFGAFSGFDCIEECFEDLTPYIHALETGLSSDPEMNSSVSALDQFQLVSSSDAHSPSKLGREATLISGELSYNGLHKAMKTGDGLDGTIEFFPEEGKYYGDGHRNCDVYFLPEETLEHGGRCPVCDKKITVGVRHRIRELSDRDTLSAGELKKSYESLMPLVEVVAEYMGFSTASKKVQGKYEQMIRELGAEFDILRKIPLEEIKTRTDGRMAEGIRRIRENQVIRIPGYDGKYGIIKVFE